MAEQFYTIITAIGKARIANANVFGNKINLTTMAVGDGNGKYYNPTEAQESLIHEVWKGNIQNISIDKDNPNWIIAEGIIPSNIGGFMVREVGLFNDEGELLVIAKYPETYKPIVSNGATKDLRIRLILEVSNAANVTLKINPAVIFVTKEELIKVEKKIDDIKVPVESVNNKTGKIELKAVDIKTDKGTNLEELSTQYEDIEKEIKNIDLEASKVKVNNSNLKSKNVNEALTELFQYADNGKKDWAEVIGEPLKSSDSFSTLKSKTQNIKDELTNKLNNKGITSCKNDELNILINKIDDMYSVPYLKGDTHKDSKLSYVDKDYLYYANKKFVKKVYRKNNTIIKKIDISTSECYCEEYSSYINHCIALMSNGEGAIYFFNEDMTLLKKFKETNVRTPAYLDKEYIYATNSMNQYAWVEVFDLNGNLIRTSEKKSQQIIFINNGNECLLISIPYCNDFSTIEITFNCITLPECKNKGEFRIPAIPILACNARDFVQINLGGL